MKETTIDIVKSSGGKVNLQASIAFNYVKIEIFRQKTINKCWI